ncbi:hypothetical protein HELRODRAFT_180578 [Helobdella robusta]|uniref:FerIin domain-containing protein n=1 Tax=Helobdella robusta TaxID=6412 RepID=T1FG25_HELRO|nr:hypothetical protein HELRODRAFT_180578 [Helobdella robusta]ESN93714.1 hypothetical protein HELRODRAFT_180578 [Helobdella robusta]
MALVVNLKTVEYLKGKYDRIVRITFRGKTLQSNVVNSAKRVAYFGQVTITFEVTYVSPDGQVGNWANRMSQQFDYPIRMQGQDEEALVAEERALLQAVTGQQAEEDENDVTSKSDRLDDDDDEDVGSGLFIMENAAYDKKSKTAYVDLQLDRPKDFEVMITIIEAQQLSGLDIDPVIKVEVGEESKYTTILGNVVAAKKMIGQFRCDLGTVYMAQDHQFYHKWAVLMDPKELDAGPKGYVKCDIAITGKGQAIKPPKSAKDDTETDNIEG